jgi:hypothetical protein
MSTKLDLSKELIGHRALITGGRAASSRPSRSVFSMPVPKS